jgi:hypothetical protein
MCVITFILNTFELRIQQTLAKGQLYIFQWSHATRIIAIVHMCLCSLLNKTCSHIYNHSLHNKASASASEYHFTFFYTFVLWLWNTNDLINISKYTCLLKPHFPLYGSIVSCATRKGLMRLLKQIIIYYTLKLNYTIYIIFTLRGLP